MHCACRHTPQLVAPIGALQINDANLATWRKNKNNWMWDIAPKQKLLCGGLACLGLWTYEKYWKINMSSLFFIAIVQSSKSENLAQKPKSSQFLAHQICSPNIRIRGRRLQAGHGHPYAHLVGRDLMDARPQRSQPATSCNQGCANGWGANRAM